MTVPGTVTLPVPSSVVSTIASLVDIVKNDIAKVFRFAAVSMVTVPMGMALLWLFLQSGMRPIYANLLSVTVSTIPNYVLNRYWVWNKRGANSVRGEIAPFWTMALLGALLSTGLVAIAEQFTDEDLVFLALNFCTFGFVWVFKFFVLEKYLFVQPEAEPVADPLGEHA